MKQLKDIIQEKLTICSKTKVNQYHYHPDSLHELKELVRERINKHSSKIDLNDIDISKITNLSYLFEDLQVTNVNMNSWNVSHVKDIHGLFWNNENIEEVHIEDWDVSNVLNAYGIFYNCKNLKILDLSKWNLSRCEKINLMFYYCENLDTRFTDKWENKLRDDIKNADAFTGCNYTPKWYKNKYTFF